MTDDPPDSIPCMVAPGYVEFFGVTYSLDLFRAIANTPPDSRGHWFRVRRVGVEYSFEASPLLDNNDQDLEVWRKKAEQLREIVTRMEPGADRAAIAFAAGALYGHARIGLELKVENQALRDELAECRRG